MGHRLARVRQRAGERRDGVGIGRQPAADPVGGHLGGVGAGVARQPGGDVGVEVVELPEARGQQQRPGSGAPRPAVLRPRPDALDVRVGGDEPLQRQLVEHAEVVGHGAERLELASALELDDPPLGALLEGVVEGEPRVVVAEAVLRRHHEPGRVDAGQHLVVRLGVGVHVADRPDADAPRAEDDVLVGPLGLAGEGVEHRAHGRRRGDGDLGVVVDAGGVVDAAALADAQHDAGELGQLGVDLVECRLVDVPQGGVGRVEVELVGEVALERSAEDEHVGAEVDVEAEVVELGPDRSERRAHRLRAVDVLRVVGVDLRHVVEGDVLQEARHRDGVVALCEDVVGVVEDARARLGERGLVDPRSSGEQDVLEGTGVVRVVGATAPLLGVGIDARRAEVDHPERQLGGDRSAEVLRQRPGGARPLREVVHPADGPGLAGRRDAEALGRAGEAVRVVVPVAVTELHLEGRRPLGVAGRRVRQLPERGVHADAAGRVDAGDPRRRHRVARGSGPQLLDRHLLGLDPDAEGAGDARGDAGPEQSEDEQGDRGLDPPSYLHDGIQPDFETARSASRFART